MGTAKTTGLRWRNGHAIAAVAGAALVMGAPSLRGGFLSGDDIQLVRDHVLVNHPSVRNTIKLFHPDANRDLYQPIPLVSFAVNFAAVHALGLTADATGPRAGAWLFHLANVLLHAANAVLLWWLLGRLCRNRFVPVAAAVLFAVHPLNVEVVAWLNGRMMLLSTLFALAALIAFDGCLAGKRRWPAVLCLAFVALTMMCKVRVALPLLMLIVPLQRRIRPPVHVWGVWALGVAITGLFTVVNLRLTLGILEAGSQTLTGSGTVRAILALGWYLLHYLVPYGLTPWYPVPNPARWSDPGLPAAGVTIVLALGATFVSLRWTRTGGLGMVWFLAAIAATLPLVPSRNLLAADRYMYLPAIGLHWIAAGLACFIFERLRTRRGKAALVSLYGIVLGAWTVGLLVTSWRNAGFYRTSVDRSRRIAQRYPEEPGVWERLAESCYSARRYAEAIHAARTELGRHPQSAACSAGQLVGMSLYRLGRIDEGLATLQAAVAADPSDGMARTRLATVYNELGQADAAVEQYNQAIQHMPGYNPAIVALGNLCVRLQRFERARHWFQRALANNKYEVPALLGLAEIDMHLERYADAAPRLEALLSWMPENTTARTYLGVCYVALGHRDDAVRTYREAIEKDSGAVAAAANLASLLADAGDFRGAAITLEHALASSPGHRLILVVYHDLLVSQGQYTQAARLWAIALAREPSATDLQAWYAWTSAQAGQWDIARRTARTVLAADSANTLASAALTLVALASGDPEAAVAHAETVARAAAPDPPDAAARLLRRLEAYATAHPDDPVPHQVASIFRKGLKNPPRGSDE